MLFGRGEEGRRLFDASLSAGGAGNDGFGQSLVGLGKLLDGVGQLLDCV